MLVLLAAILTCAAGPAQDAATPPTPADLQSKVEPLRDQLKTLRDQLAAATDLEPDVRKKLEEELQGADENLTGAETSLKDAVDFAQQTTQVQTESEDLKKKLDALKAEDAQQASKPPVVPEDATLEQLKQTKSELEQSLQTFQSQEQQRDDPLERATKRKNARDLLVSLPQEITRLSQPSTVPEGELPLVTQARQLATQSQILEYQSELLAAQNRISLYDAEDAYDVARLRREWQDKQIQRISSEIKAYDNRISFLGQQEAIERVNEARSALSPKEGTAPPALVREVITGPLTIGDEQLKGSLQLAQEEVEVRSDREQRVQDLESVKQELQQVQTWLGQAETRVETTGPTQALGFRLRQQRERLPDLLQVRREKAARLEEIESAQNSFLDYTEQLDAWTNTESIVDELLKSPDAPRGEAARASLKDALTTAVDQRKKFLTDLVQAYSAYTETLDELDQAEGSLIDETESFTDFMDERILWIRSNRPLIQQTSLESFRNDRLTLLWLLNGAAFPEARRAIWRDMQNHYLMWGALAVLFAVLLIRTSAMRKKLRELARVAQGRVTTAMKPTIEAWLISAVISLPWPALILLCAWRLSVASDSAQVSMLSSGLMQLGFAFLALEFFRQVCRPSGLADAHFEWPDRSVVLLRRTFRGLIAFALPAGAIVVLLHAHESGPGLETDAFEMLAFAITMLIFVFFMHRLLKPSTGVLREWIASHEDGWGRRLQYPLYVAGVGLFGLLAVLTVVGYYYTAQRLLEKTQITLWLVLGLVFVRAMLYRALALHRRRLALEQLRQRRAAAEEAAAGETAGSGVPDIAVESQTDLGHVSRQTQKLLNTTLVIVGLAAVWAVWIDVLPALNYLKQWKLWPYETTIVVDRPATGGGTEPVTETVVDYITYVDLAVAVLFTMLTVTAAKNVPGLLEISILQRLPLDASARYATTAITRYLIVLGGIFLVSNSIGIGWGQVQWLAAALTFGLGFGLQEIFANFVSGIIILFEQPVRVGDVVTIGEVTGIVSRIRMRSTTITDWDRKEYVVPNKEFITGRLLNWTLSDTTNRIVINVGVAYGSDTNKVREIIMRLATEQPHILKDPAPMVTFESFGDSSLNFVLRAYLPALDQRLNVISDLHSSIHNELAQAGIEIPFPQRDLHLKSWPADLDRILSQPEELYQHDG